MVMLSKLGSFGGVLRQKRRISMRANKTFRRAWAFLMATVMALSLMLGIRMPNVQAAVVNQYNVKIQFFEFDKITPKNPQLSTSGGNSYHVLATLTDKTSGEVVGYGYTQNITAINDSVYGDNEELNIRDFWTTAEEEHGWYKSSKRERMYYDPDIHDISLRLYYGQNPYVQWGNYYLAYSELIKQTDHIDGYLFMQGTTGTTGVLSIFMKELRHMLSGLSSIHRLLA